MISIQSNAIVELIVRTGVSVLGRMTLMLMVYSILFSLVVGIGALFLWFIKHKVYYGLQDIIIPVAVPIVTYVTFHVIFENSFKKFALGSFYGDSLILSLFGSFICLLSPLIGNKKARSIYAIVISIISALAVYWGMPIYAE